MNIKKLLLIFPLVLFFNFTPGIVVAQETTTSNVNTETVTTPAFTLDGSIRTLIPQEILKILEFKILNYELWRLLFILLLVFLSWIINNICRRIIKKYSKKLDKKEKAGKKTFLGSTVLSLRRPLRVLIWAMLLRIIGLILIAEHTPIINWVSDTLISIALVLFIYDFIEVVEFFMMLYVQKTKTKLDDMLVPIIKNSLRVIVIIIAGMYLYQSISGQDITTIIAGLGLAGMAVALAAQDSLKNLFGFIMIVLDKPFNIGERINFDGHDGIIEEVGLRSTKMRRLDGHVVTIPNMKAADGVIHNISRRPNIRRIMDIGITYDTPVNKVEKAIEIVKNVLKNHEGMDPDLPPFVFFNDLKTDCLNIFAIYWYHPPAYWDYMAHAQYVNLQIMKRFKKEGIEFAFPTQTIYLTGDDAHKLEIRHEGLDELVRSLEAGKKR